MAASQRLQATITIENLSQGSIKQIFVVDFFDLAMQEATRYYSQDHPTLLLSL